jgi:hypothetical protein
VAIAPAVKTAVVQAFYPGVLKQAEDARGRAQNGYAIAGAVAAAIVAAGVFGDIGKEQDFVQGLGVGALVLWLAAAVVFMWAVAAKVEVPTSEDAADADAFVTAVLDRAKTERETIESRIDWALGATVLAIVVTVVALILALTTSAAAKSVSGTLVLTKAGTTTVGQVCGGTPATVSVNTDPAGLSAAVVKVVITNGCTKRPGKVTLRLAKGTISGFAAD